MADPNDLRNLKEWTYDLTDRSGEDGWNAWRRYNPKIPDLSGADLSGVDLSVRDLGQEDHLMGHPELPGKDLRDANFSRADLRSANLHKALLANADLRKAYLWETHLAGADLSGADLSGANLVAAYLGAANLSGANLSGANLVAANFTGADLRGAKFMEATVGETVFSDTNLRGAQGLDNCNHQGPSILDHRTFAKSGPLPLVFLRGCGLPDKLIDYLPTLLNDAIQFYSCFISYSSIDSKFAEQLYADLQNNGIRCWFAPHDIRSGKKIHEQIDEAVRLYDRLLLILSDHSMKSSWVETEISKARRRELREGRRILFPVRLVDFEALRDWECFDADTGKDSAREIRECFIPDFSNWQAHDSYQPAFERLLRDLAVNP
jgi:uncharacterized protein YjbI with pentapeptide repeats